MGEYNNSYSYSVEILKIYRMFNIKKWVVFNVYIHSDSLTNDDLWDLKEDGEEEGTTFRIAVKPHTSE